MRVEFAQAIVRAFPAHEDLVFLTGDLGFMALEEVEKLLGDRFINAGVAEQNMISVAASLAHEGFVPFVYSISPFVTLRPYEQIRNDVCLHKLPVKIVGNGGGFGYGIMGSTHHNLEDIGILRMLPDMRVYVPVTAQDVFDAVDQMIEDPRPNYLRLNMTAKIPDAAAFAPWRKFKSGKKLLVVSTGPIVGNLFQLEPSLLEQLEIWSVGIFPLQEFPEELIRRISEIGNIVTLEEHSGQGGLNETFAAQLLQHVHGPIKYNSLFSRGYISGKYGDQNFHQQENNLAGDGLKNSIESFLRQ